MGDFKNSTFVHKYKWPSWLPNHREITDYTLNCQVDFNSFFFSLRGFTNKCETPTICFTYYK